MARRKLIHFAEMAKMPHVFEFPKDMKGQWAHYFGNSNPIVLEVGCGTGAYTVGLAALSDKQNVIGIDIKGNRMWQGAKAVEAQSLKHAAFLRTRIEQITDYFAASEVAEAWITFPDPQPRISREKKRLPGKRFVALLHQIMVKNGLLHLKTDDQDLFAFSMEVWSDLGLTVLKQTTDLYAAPISDERLSIQTVYEKKFRAEGKTICYACACLPDVLRMPFLSTNSYKIP